MLQAGIPIQSVDYKNQTPLEYALDTNQVSHQTFYRILELFLDAELDIMKKSSEVVRGRKKGSLWEQIIRSGRLTEDLIGLVKEKMGGALKVEDFAVASRLLRADRGINAS